jgi:hypothetical protein
MEKLPPNIEVKKILLSTKLQTQIAGQTATSSNVVTPAGPVGTFNSRPANSTPIAQATQQSAQPTPAIPNISPYNSVKFILPNSYTNIVYADWSFCSGLVAPCCCSIEEFYQPALTLNGVSYWKYLQNSTTNTNSSADYLPVVPNFPTTLNTITLKLFDENGSLLRQTTDWLLEIILIRNLDD